jgi:PQQ-dependent catabolism-associated beta-propeller protein
VFLRNLLATAIGVLALAAGQVEAGTLFVSNERDNTVTVLDAATLKIVKTIPVGRRPRGLVITPDFREVLVCAGDDNRIDVIDTQSLTVTRGLSPGPDPETLGLSPSGKTVYIANEDDSMVTMLDRVSGQLLGRIPVGIEPEGVAINSDESIAVVVSESTSMAHFFDPQSQKVTANVLVDARPRVAVFTPDEKYVWVSAEIGGTVAVINAVSKQVERKISFSVPGVRKEFIQPEGVRFGNGVAFVALGRANHVAVVDMHTFEAKDYGNLDSARTVARCIRSTV